MCQCRRVGPGTWRCVDPRVVRNSRGPARCHHHRRVDGARRSIGRALSWPCRAASNGPHHHVQPRAVRRGVGRKRVSPDVWRLRDRDRGRRIAGRHSRRSTPSGRSGASSPITRISDTRGIGRGDCPRAAASLSRFSLETTRGLIATWRPRSPLWTPIPHAGSPTRITSTSTSVCGRFREPNHRPELAERIGRYTLAARHQRDRDSQRRRPERRGRGRWRPGSIAALRRRRPVLAPRAAPPDRAHGADHGSIPPP